MRKTVSLDGSWKFIKADLSADETETADGKNVVLPHTWNNSDGQDGGNDYYRGACWYVKRFKRPNVSASDEVYIEFKGVNSSAKVYLNGCFVTSHDGGYSTFRAHVTHLLKDDNLLCVRVDNGVTECVYPQTADFTFYGGIYRPVNLLCLDKIHFDAAYYGSNGIKIDSKVSDGDGIVTVTAFSNGGKARVTIYDEDGLNVASGESGTPLKIKGARLWDGKNAASLYTANVRLYDGERLCDELNTQFGFRSFHIDPQKGFFLNGRPYPLHGVCRHQDRKNMGNAITKAEHDEDFRLILETGANTIRLAHYQHDDYFYELCDRYGIIVWAEIPYISRHMPEADENAVQQMKELIFQQYNHPSIVVWGISNEITMYRKNRKDMLSLHRSLNDMCHRIDPDRLTVLACYAVCSPFNRVAHITDIVSWNLYLGWYVPGMFLNDVWINLFKFFYRKRCLGFSEYGAEGMPNLHSSRPRRGDNTEEYQAKYHEFMLKCFARHPSLWATHLWNMFDFAADARNQGGEPGMNHKGLITFDRKTKKDSFYLYKAYWSDEPFIHLCGKRFVNRTGGKLKIKVYTNLESVTLFVNGKEIATKRGSKVFQFSLPMQDNNQITVQSGQFSDSGRVVRVRKKDPSYSIAKGKNKSWQK